MNRLAFRRALRRELVRGADRHVEIRGHELTGIWIDELSDLLSPDPIERDTPAASGTAREAPSGSSSGDPKRISDGAAPSPLLAPLADAYDRLYEATGVDPSRPIGDAIAKSARRVVAAATDTAPYARMAKSRLAQKMPPRPVVDRSRLPVAESREGCRRCGVRGDLGCEHQRGMGEA